MPSSPPISARAPSHAQRSSPGSVPRGEPGRFTRRRASVLGSRQRALFLAPEAPYPLNGGGALRTASLLEYLVRHYDVHVIVFREPGAPDPAERLPPSVKDITVLNLEPNRRTLAARALRNAGRALRS